MSINNFPVFTETHEELNNYDLFLMPNGIYRAKKIIADNYLYPMYYYKDGDDYIVSTSVYSLIAHKGKFVRNPRFQTAHFYRPTFQTIDSEIMRLRTTHRRSSLELTDPKEITRLGVELIQDYVVEMEQKYPGWVHVLSMGGKDSQNIILTNRKERWIVLSGKPNAPLNEKFIEQNGIEIERFISASNVQNDTLLTEEIIASDCGFDPAHFRWVNEVKNLVDEFDGKVVFWMGTSGDGCFSRNNNHRDKDYYAVHDLHVGTAMGILHQVFKNLLNIPVVSPYQSPSFLDRLFYKYDPYFVDQSGDVRKKMGELLWGRPVIYPESNPTPSPWKRNRADSINIYVNRLKREGVSCKLNPVRSLVNRKYEEIVRFLNRHSNKRRTKLSKILFPLRKSLSRVLPFLKIDRHDIAATEIR